MWTIILPTSGTITGVFLAYLARFLKRRRSPRSDNSGGTVRQGYLRSLIQACKQMAVLHVFDRVERIYLHANPERTEAAKQIETQLTERLGLKVSPNRKKQLAPRQEDSH